ncbi:MAG: helix-turn-helix transcriptional regulator [Magnetococcales bacterium]|nr:helix-turn-helix transcriptional regulator [Magnetococcales bacterium]
MERDISVLRREKLAELIRQEGSQSGVARKIDTDPSYLSQIMSAKGRRNVGEALARRIEERFNKKPGWMDSGFSSDSTPYMEVSQDMGDSLDDFVLIPHYTAAASMGPGEAQPDDDQINGHLAFKNVWLKKRRLNPRFLTVIDAVGDSMHPTISNGDVLLVDLRQKEPIDNRIFVLRMEDQLYAKRLQKRPNHIINIHSDNPLSPPFEINLENSEGVDIIGRVIWAGKDL